MPVHWYSLLLITFVFLGFAHDSIAQTTQFESSQIELKANMRLNYEAYSEVQSLRPKVREDFTITIRDLWPNGVSFGYAIE